MEKLLRFKAAVSIPEEETRALCLSLMSSPANHTSNWLWGSRGIHSKTQRALFVQAAHSACVSMLLPTLCANASHIRLSQWPQSHMTAMRRHLHPCPPHLTSNGLGQLVHSMESAEQASEGASQWGMWTDRWRKQSCIYWKAHLGCTE